mgnify:CR=1 FL=1
MTEAQTVIIQQSLQSLKDLFSQYIKELELETDTENIFVKVKEQEIFSKRSSRKFRKSFKEQTKTARFSADFSRSEGMRKRSGSVGGNSKSKPILFTDYNTISSTTGDETSTSIDSLGFHIDGSTFKITLTPEPQKIEPIRIRKASRCSYNTQTHLSPNITQNLKLSNSKNRSQSYSPLQINP